MPHVCRRKVARLAPDVLRRLAKGFAAEKQEARSRAGATIKNGSKTVWWTFMFYWFTIYICLFTIYILLFFSCSIYLVNHLWTLVKHLFYYQEGAVRISIFETKGVYKELRIEFPNHLSHMRV